MRVGFDRSFKRRAVLAALAVVALVLIIAPVAAAAPMTVIGNTWGHYYNGNKLLPSLVDVYPFQGDPATADPIAEQFSTNGALFALSVDLTVPSQYLGYPIYADAGSNFILGQTTFDFVPGGAIAIDIVSEIKATVVSGAVKDAKTHKPIKGAKVVIPGGPKKGVLTSKKGKFSVTTQLWQSTSYKATVSKSGYKTVKQSFKSSPGGTSTVNVTLKKSS